MSTSDSTGVTNSGSASGILKRIPEDRQDEQIERQRKIEEKIASPTPLVSELQKISSWNSKHGNDTKVKDLASKYQAIRCTRYDNKCFYRAFTFAYLEHILRNKEEFSKFLNYCQISRVRLRQAGFVEKTIEDYYKMFMKFMGTFIPGGDISKAFAALYGRFVELGCVDHVFVYLCLIVFCQPKQPNYSCDIRKFKEFWDQIVQSTYRKSDPIHINAICSALGVGIRIEYVVDQGDGKGNQVIGQDFPNGCKPNVYLLYRPGQYDILYPHGG